MDQALFNQYLQSRGITDADMATRLRNAFAANPDILERRMLNNPRQGARGAEDTFDVDKMIEQALPAGTITVGQPEKIERDVAPAPSNIRPAVKKQGEVAGTDNSIQRESKGSPLQKYNPAGSDSAIEGLRRGSNQNSPQGASTSDFTIGVGTGRQVGETKRSDFTDWLLGALAAGGAALGGRALINRGTAAPTTNATPTAMDAEFGGGKNPVNPIDTTTDPQAARKAQLRAEIDAENAKMREDTMMEEMIRRAEVEKIAKQNSARATFDAAKRLYRR